MHRRDFLGQVAGIPVVASIPGLTFGAEHHDNKDGTQQRLTPLSVEEKGYWLIDNRGVKQPVWHTLADFYREARRYVTDYKHRTGRLPKETEFRRFALNSLGWKKLSLCHQPKPCLQMQTQP